MIHVYRKRLDLSETPDFYEFVGEFEKKIEADKKINQLAKNGADKEDFRVYPKQLELKTIEPEFRIKVR